MALVRHSGNTFTNRYGTVHDLTAADDSNTLFGSTDDVITVTDSRNFTAAGQYFIYNKKIILDDAAATIFLTANGTAANTGFHCDFINCDISVVQMAVRFGVGTVNNNANRSRDARVATGAAAGASMNFIGCVVDLYDFPHATQLVLTDLIDCDFRMGISAIGIFVLNQNRGARNSNTTETYLTTNAVVEHNFYGPPANYDAPIVTGARLRCGSGAGPEQILIPDLTQDENQTKFFWSFGQSNNPGFIVAGFRKIVNATDTDFNNLWNSNGVAGSVVYYQPYQAVAFDNPSLDTPVQGVRTRITSNANLSWDSTNYDTFVSSGASSTNFIQDFVTNAQGVITPVQYSTNGGTSFTAGYLNYGTGNSVANITDTSFVSTTEGQELVDSTYLIPIQVWRSTAGDTTVGNAPTNIIDERSYSHDIGILENVVDADYTIGTDYHLEQRDIIGASLSGNRLKATNVNPTTGAETISFTGGSTETASLQDFSNIARAVWAQFGFDPQDYYGTDPGDLPATGPFDERDWGLRPVISSTDPSGDSSANVIASGTGWSVQNFNGEGQLRIAVWAPGGLAGDTTNDIVGQDPTRINSHNNGGTPLVGTVLNTPGGAINFSRIEDSTVTVSGGEIEFDPQRTSTADTFIRGNVTLEHSAAFPNNNITNFPRVAGRPSLEDNWTIVSGRLRTDDDAQSGTGSANDPGIWDGSVWNNGTTMSGVTVDKLTGDLTIAGGSHSFVLTNAPTTNINLTISDSPTLNIDLPTGLPTGLVTINTGNQTGTTTQYTIVKAWLDAQGVAYSEELTAANGGTPPTSGYWLVGTPAEVFPRTVTLQSPKDGFVIYKELGTAGVGTTVNTTSSTTGTIISGLDSVTDTDYAVYWKPISGADNIYNTRYVAWNPSTDGNLVLVDLEPDPTEAVTAGVTQTTLNAVTVTSDGTLTTFVDNGGNNITNAAIFTVTSAKGSYTAQEGQSLGVHIGNTIEFVRGLAVRNFTQTQVNGALAFGSNVTTLMQDWIAVISTTTQKVFGGVTGFSTNVLGTGDSVISSSNIILVDISATTQAELANIDAKVTAMRTNKLLGLKPQSASSGGDFTV